MNKALDVFKREMREIDDLVDLKSFWSRWTEKFRYMPRSYVFAEAMINVKTRELKKRGKPSRLEDYF
jgi:hypothetical protein